MEDQLVSVLMAAYNHEKYVKSAVQSVLDQSYSNLELLVIDDRSTDRTASVIASIQDERLHFQTAPVNRGAAGTFNELIDRARGTYLAFIGSDDIWNPEKLEKQVAYLEEHPEVAACFSDVAFMDADGRIYECEGEQEKKRLFGTENRTRGEWIKYFCEESNCLCHPSVLIRTSTVKKIGYFNNAYRQLHDFDYWLRLLLNDSFYVYPEKLLKYRRVLSDNSSISGSNRTNYDRTMNESFSIFMNLFRKMDGSLLKDLLKNDDIDEKDELRVLCEKFFFIRKTGFYFMKGRAFAVQFLNSFSVDNRLQDYLLQHYNYTVTDLYKESSEAWSLFPLNSFEEFRKIETDLQTIRSSAAWKLLKPAREVVKKVRK